MDSAFCQFLYIFDHKSIKSEKWVAHRVAHHSTPKRTFLQLKLAVNGNYKIKQKPRKALNFNALRGFKRWYRHRDSNPRFSRERSEPNGLISRVTEDGSTGVRTGGLFRYPFALVYFHLLCGIVDLGRIDVCINIRRDRDVGVPHQFLCGPDVHAGTAQV